ncbi:MAG: terminase family protein [Chitinivibrionia bacterium]|nr:terminase family protein [Chitinivibrionia bacterium]
MLDKIKAYMHEKWKFTSMKLHDGQLSAIYKFTEQYDDKSMIAVSSGNNFGKTHLMCSIIINMCYPPEFRTFTCPLFDDYDRKKANGDEIGIWVIGTMENFKPSGAIYLEMKKLDPTCDIRFRDRLLIINGQTITLKTHDQSVDQFAGPRLFAIFSDEPMKEPIFHECNLRLTDPSNANKFMLFFTPVSNRATYMADYMEEPDWLWIKGSIYDNPHSTPKQIAKIERIVAINPDEKEARFFGNFRKFSGRVFKTFNPTEHVIPSLPPDLYNYYVSIDPHDVKSCFAILWAVNLHGQKIAIDCFPQKPWNQIKSDQLDVRQQVDAINEMAYKHGVQDFKVYGDPIYYNMKRSHLDGKYTLAENFARAGMPIITAPVATLWEDGIQAINEHLHYCEDYLPMLFVCEEAKNVIDALIRFSWKTNEPSARTAISANIEAEWECPISAIRFLLTADPAIPRDVYNYIPELKKPYDNKKTEPFSRL